MKLFAALISIFSFSAVFANTLPQLSTTHTASTICPDQWNTSLFDSVKVTDADGDLLTIINVTTSTPTTLSAGNLFWYDNQPQAGSSNFWIYGNTLSAGTGTIIIEVSDGTDTVALTLPNITVYQPMSIYFTEDTLIFCSNYGTVNLNDYVNQPGGEFNSSSLEWNSNDGLIDPATIFWTENEPASFNYIYTDNGCQVTASTEIIYFSAGSLNLATTKTNCGQAVGSAIYSLVGGAPAESSSWSNGVTNQTSISNLSSGQYTLSIIDTNHCLIEQTFSIELNGVVLTPTVTDVQCFGQSNGSVSVTSTGLAAPVTYFWSSGHTGSSVSGLAAGTYTVYATDAANCQTTKDIVINQPAVLYVEDYSVWPNCGATDGVLEVANISGGVSPYTVQWSNGSTSNPQPNVGFGVYSATITDNNGCQTIKTVYLSENNSADLYGTVVPTQCGQNTGAIDANYWIPSGDPVQSITWSNGATTEDIANLTANNYVCTLTVANTGCRAVKGWNVPVVAPLRQDICIVTVDSLTTTNLVVWEKVQPVGIIYYNIYRETSVQGQYVLIDTVNFDNLSAFNDVVASPNDRSWSYKIGAVNVCNVEGPLSPAHKTIHLDLVDNSGTSVTINWNSYLGTQFTDYVLWRYTDTTGWQNIVSVPNTVLSYTDNIPFSAPGLDYMVEFELTTPCSAEKAQDFNTVRSNRERGQFAAGEGVDGVSTNGIEENYLNNIGMYPNPTSDKLTFIQDGNEKVTYSILSLSGQLMQTSQSSQSNTVLDLSQLNSGVYLVELKMNDIRIIKRVVKL